MPYTQQGEFISLDSEKNQKLNHWQVVEEQIERNQQPRINWKPLLGMSLTKAVARFRAAGLTAKQTLDALYFEHPELTEEAKRRLKIGVCARFGEMGSVESELKKARRK